MLDLSVLVCSVLGMHLLFHQVILTKLLFEHFFHIILFDHMFNTHSPFSSIYQFSIFLYTSLQIKLHRGMYCLWGRSCTFSSESSVSLVCTFLCVPCGTYGLRCSLLWQYTTPSGVQTLNDRLPRYS